MSDEKPKTADDIVSELREKYASHYYCEDSTRRDGEYPEGFDVIETRKLADSIEEAVKREREAILADAAKLGRGKVEVVYAADRPQGNAAAMREALVVVRKDLWEMMGSSSDSFRERKACDMARRIRAALSAPARNCERFDNWDDAEAEYQRLVEEGKVEDGTWCEWLWNIAKEGGTR